MSNNKERSEREPVSIASFVLPDGSLVELTYSREERRTALAVGSGDTVEVVTELTLEDGTTLIPISPNNNLVQHEVVVLPEKPEPCGTPETLVAEIEEYMDRYLDLSPMFRSVASTYVLLSWVYDAFNELPYLRFRGDFGTGKTRALTVIGSILYKGFFASGASTVSPIFHILDKFRGTLILDEADFRFSDEKAELSKILNNGNVNGFPVLRQTMNVRKEFDPRAFQVFGPKLIGSRQSFEDAALESRFLTEDMGMRPLRSDIPLNLPKSQKEEARGLRNKLLSYRFLFRDETVIHARRMADGQSARTNQIVTPLLSVAPTQIHADAIAHFAEGLDREVRTDRAQSLEAALLDVVVELFASSHGSAVPVSEVAKCLAAKVGSDTDRTITPKYIGFLLRKRLHLKTVRVSGVYVVPQSEESTVDFLARKFGLD